MRLNLEDIGRLAGVSRSTVSRVVNGGDRVRPEVRARVEEVIRQTGYTPNLAARSLASNRTGVIGLVIPSGVHNLFADPYFAELITGVTAASNGAGVSLTLFLFQTEAEERSLTPRIVDSGFLDGVIVTATRMDDPLVARIADHSMPLVMVGRPDLDTISHVDVDNRGGAAAAAGHLLDTGAHRIGAISAPANTTTGRDRLDGFADELARHGRPLDPALCVDGGYTDEGGFRAMHTLLDAGVDAVFAASDTMALGALRAARERGVDVPSDVGVVGFDGFATGRPGEPVLTTVRQPVGRTASRAVELLLRLVDQPSDDIVAEVLPVELVPGATTRPLSPDPIPTTATHLTDQMENPS